MQRSVSSYIDEFTVPKPLQICDVTLREGEQTAGVAYTMEERIELIRKLDEAKIHQVQLYSTWCGDQVNKGYLDLCEQLCSVKRKITKVEVLNFYTDDLDKLKKMIDLQASIHPDIIHACFNSTPNSYDGWCDSTPDELARLITATSEYINSKGLQSNISLIDSTRSDPKILQKLVRAAVQGGASRVRLADTVGVATPDAITNICKAAMEAIDGGNTILGLHTHNDFGLGLACALAGVRAGATLLDASINGLGERCGNTSLVEMVLALEGLYGINTGVDVSKLVGLSRYAEKISGIPVSKSAPFVGKFAFSDTIAQHIISSSYKPFAYQGILPQEIGAERITIFGKGVNREVIRLTAKKAGRNISEELFDEIYEALYQMEDGAKGVTILEKEFWDIVDCVEKKHDKK